VSQPDQTLVADVAPAAKAAVPTKSSLPASKFWSRFAIPLFAVLVALGFVALATLRWNGWTGNARIQVTDGAYVRADLTRLSSRVAGQVLKIAVQDFQRVNKYDLLVEIDPADYQAQLDQAEAAVIGALGRTRQSGQSDRAPISNHRAGRSSASILRSPGNRGTTGRGAPAIAVTDRCRHAAMTGIPLQIEHWCEDWEPLRPALGRAPPGRLPWWG
jgi:membrane fusion protein (multidrug efflux system)